MAKYFGKIGFEMTTEDPLRPGVWREIIVEREYYGDIIKTINRIEPSSDQINDNIDISNQISIVADAFICKNFASIRYIYFMGAKWKVKSSEIQRPRLILSIGGLYNEH